MKRFSILISVLTMIMAACNDHSKSEPSNIPTPQQDKVEVKTVIRDTVQKNGTSIKINDNGVSYESKDGAKKTHVKIAGDSAGLEITRPK